MSTAIVQQSGAVQAKRLHLEWLDSLRALAALYVALNHIVQIVFPRIGNLHGLTLALAGPFRYGHSAVGLFIVLSGFSLMIPVTRENGLLLGGALAFFWRRAKRILPPYFCALGLSLLMIHFLIGSKTGSAWDADIPVTKADVLTHILLLQDIFSRAKINNALWSVSVEWRIYFLFPTFVLLFSRWGGIKATLGTLAAASIALLVFQRTGLTILCGTMPAYFALFTMGMLACEISLGRHKQLCVLRDKVPWLPATLLVWLMYLVLLYKWRGSISPSHLFFQDTIDGVLSAMLLVALSKLGNSRLRDCLSWKPLVFVGTFAYSVYLIHLPIVQVVWQYGLHPLHKGLLVTYCLLIVFSVPAIIGSAYLFFLVFERPFLNTKKRESMVETAGDAVLEPAP